MFRKTNIPYRKAGILPSLVLDYIEGKENLKEYYGFFPDKEGFKKSLAENYFIKLNRTGLSSVLKQQAASVANTSILSSQNIVKLASDKCYTVTTGHQLCLFSGPIYFIYKIISVINLCRQLKTWFPENEFVPVYWMATEDHDFDEVNHFYVFGKKLEWKKRAAGAVGDVNTEDLAELRDELRTILGNAPYAGELLSLFERTYLKHPDLKTATRFLVNELFGEDGIVIADGNDKIFKNSFRDILSKDVFDHLPFKEVKETSEKLAGEGYKLQVNPRRVNCFYLEKGLRARIEKKDNIYFAAGTSLKWSEKEFRELIEISPEKLSPNVVLRPVYQQFLLPNIAYVGGPGELSYWLQYKKMFSALNIPFPVLCPRNSASIVEKTIADKTGKLGLSAEEIFEDENSLQKRLLIKSGEYVDVTAEKKRLANIFEEAGKKIQEADITLKTAVQAELQKALNAIDSLELKANRAIKNKSDTQIKQLSAIKSKLFPEGMPQERQENLSSFYSRLGQDFIKELKGSFDPLIFSHIAMEEL